VAVAQSRLELNYSPISIGGIWGMNEEPRFGLQLGPLPSPYSFVLPAATFLLIRYVSYLHTAP
jgi:hypothetical protein